MVLDTYVEATESHCPVQTFPKEEILYQFDKTYSKFSTWVSTDEEEPQSFRYFCIQFNSTAVLKDRFPKDHITLTDLRVVYPINSQYTWVYILVTAIL